MAVVDLRPRLERVARVQIERHVQPLDRGPEAGVLRRVAVDDVRSRLPMIGWSSPNVTLVPGHLMPLEKIAELVLEAITAMTYFLIANVSNGRVAG